MRWERERNERVREGEKRGENEMGEREMRG